MELKVSRKRWSRVVLRSSLETLEDFTGREVSIGDHVATFTDAPISGIIVGYDNSSAWWFGQKWTLFIAVGGDHRTMKKVVVADRALAIVEDPA